jgi:prephenate dehydrogenase
MTHHMLAATADSALIIDAHPLTGPAAAAEEAAAAAAALSCPGKPLRNSWASSISGS